MPSLRFRKSTSNSTEFAAPFQFSPLPPTLQSTQQDDIESHADTIDIRPSNSLHPNSCLKRQWSESSTRTTDRRVRFRSLTEVYVFHTSKDMESAPDFERKDKTRGCSLRFYLFALNLLRRKPVEQPLEETESLCNAANDQVKCSPSNLQNCEVRETTIDLGNYSDPESCHACSLSKILEHPPRHSTSASAAPSKTPSLTSLTSVSGIYPEDMSFQISSSDACSRPIATTSHIPAEISLCHITGLPRGDDTKTAPSQGSSSHSRSSSPPHTPELVPTMLETAQREGLHTSPCETTALHVESGSNCVLRTSRQKRSWSVEAVKSFSPSPKTLRYVDSTCIDVESQPRVRRAVCHRRSDAQSNICFPVNRS